MTTTDFHTRNTTKHEYEVGREYSPRLVFVGNREQTAILNAVEILADYPEDTHLRLYHTHPSPGPVRRYVGLIDRDGKLHRAG